MYMRVVCCEPLMVSANVFCDPYVFGVAGAMSVPPLHGPPRDAAQKTLLGLARQPVLPETMRK